MVDWKKEYKTSDLFKRRRVAATAEPALDPAGNKAPKVEALEGVEAVETEPAGQPAQSLLKKEIHLFGGRSKAAKEPKKPTEREPASRVPWYKKEVSLKKSKAETDAQPEAPAEPSVPWYKKEVSLGRKPAIEARLELPSHSLPEGHAVQLSPVEAGPEPVAPAVEVEPLAPPVEAAAPPVVHAVPDPEPVVHIAPVPDPEPEVLQLPPLAAVEPELEPEPPRAVSWVDAVLEARPPLPEPVSEAPVVEPVPEAPVVPVLPVVPLSQPAPVQALPVQALPPQTQPESLPEPVAELVAEPEPEPDARPVHPPVTADQLPPLEDEQPAAPWYKRELSLGRKKEKEPFEPDAPKTPFWKKDLSLGRAPKKERAAQPAATEAAPVAKAVPFWKKELSFGRGAKEKPERTPEPVAVEASSDGVAEKPVPFWKRDLSFGKQKQPKAPKEPGAETPAKAASQPFWKRDFALNVSLPQRGGGGGAKGSMPKQIVGLKIGASQVAAARVSNNGHAEVLQVARQPLDQGVIVGGELRDPDALAEVLKDFFRRNKLPKRGVRLGIANNRIGVRTFEIGGIEDQKQLANAIRFRAQETLPIPIEEAVLDYQVLDETVNEEGERVRKVLLVVAYRELVDRYVDACRKAGIVLAGIDLEAFALLRALAAPREGESDNAAVVAVAVGHDRSTFAVSDGRVCEFTRVLEWGGQNLNVAIARALDMTPSEAEPVKHLLSLDGGPTPEGISEEQHVAARDATVVQVNNFARELVSSLQFYQSQPGSLGISEIILTGGTAHLHGLASQLQRLIGVKVRIGDPMVRVKVSRKLREPEQVGSLSVAIGLGIED